LTLILLIIRHTEAPLVTVVRQLQSTQEGFFFESPQNPG
jgi:hypothetical protein